MICFDKGLCADGSVGMRLLFCGGMTYHFLRIELYKSLDILCVSPYANHSKIISYAELKVLFLNVYHSIFHFMSPC